MRPLSPVIVCGVGGLVAAVWLGAIFLNVAPAVALPAWLRGIVRTPLTLAVPALAIPALFVLLAWPRRARPAHHARTLAAVQGLALAVVALPSLLPMSPDLLSISPGIHFVGPLLLLAVAVRVPALSLGVAVAMADRSWFSGCARSYRRVHRPAHSPALRVAPRFWLPASS